MCFKLAFLVVCCGGTMKSEEFLLSQTLPSCSNHPSSPEQSKAGNPGRSVVLSTDTQPPSSFPASSLLFSSYLFLLLLLCFITVSHGHHYLCFTLSKEKSLLSSFYALHCSFSHCPLFNFLHSALLPSHLIFFFLFCTLIPCFSTTIPSK